MPKSTIKAAPFLLSSLLLTACGGGGSSNDSENNTAKTTVDTTAPTIALLGNNPINLIVGSSYSDSGATAADNVDGNISANIITNASAVDSAVAGSYTVTYNVSDNAGNGAIQVTRTVNVVAQNANDNPPSVSVSAPTNGATVSGTIPLSATATDDVSVAGVQFQLDGINIGAEDTTAPYSISFDTTTTSNGSHSLIAVARDSANQTRSATINVTVNNPATPPACSDGADNDGDGLTDFPNDPGCASLTDSDEFDTLPSPSGAPNIHIVSGSLSDGQQITISGSNFGVNGPNVILFDDFKRGATGSDISLNASIGNWTIRNHTPTYGIDSQGNIAGRFIGDGGGKLIAQFADTQEIFVSYRVQIPLGKHFPNSGAPNTFPPGSQWKLTWLMDGDRGAAGNDDLVLPTWGNGTYFSIAGNDSAFQLETGRATGNTRWFSFQDWNRYSVYMKGGANPTVDPGTVWTQGMSNEFGQKIFESIDKRIFDGDDTPDSYKFSDDNISRWNRFNVPGWHRGGDNNAAAIYDDIYIATGAHARARIEIGNSPVYADSTVLAIATPTSWQDNTITTTIRQGAFQAGQTTYLFVIDENGNASNGFPFTFGSTIP